MKNIVWVVVAVLACVVGYLALQVNQGFKMDGACRAYVDRVVPQVAQAWDADVLIQHASPQMLKSTSPARIRARCASCARRYGALRSYRGCSGKLALTFTNQLAFDNTTPHGTNTRAMIGTYTARVSCDRGDARVRLHLIQNDGNWQILRFDVLSDTPSR